LYLHRIFLPILGLRSLYFALASVIEKFRYLKVSLVYILIYVGLKNDFIPSFPIPTFVSLLIILTILLTGIFASVVRCQKETARMK